MAHSLPSYTQSMELQEILVASWDCIIWWVEEQSLSWNFIIIALLKQWQFHLLFISSFHPALQVTYVKCVSVSRECVVIFVVCFWCLYQTHSTAYSMHWWNHMWPKSDWVPTDRVTCNLGQNWFRHGTSDLNYIIIKALRQRQIIDQGNTIS